jgi:hypothetical protein
VLSHSGVRPPLSNQLISHVLTSSLFPRLLLFVDELAVYASFSSLFAAVSLSFFLITVIIGPSLPGSKVSHLNTS